MNNFKITLEILEKEVWHIARVEIPKLKSILDGLDPSLLSSLDKTVKQFSGRIEQLESASLLTATEIENLKTSLSDISQTVSEDSQKISSLKYKTQEIEKNLGGITKQLEEVGTSIEALQSADIEINEGLDQAKDSISELSSSLVLLTDSLTSTNNSLANLSYRVSENEEEVKKIPEIQNSLSAAEKAISTHDETLQTLQTNVDNVTEDLGTTKNSLNNLSYRVSTTEEEVKKIASIEQSVTEVEATASANAEDISALQAQTENISKDVESAQNSLTNVSYRVSEIEKSVDGLPGIKNDVSSLKTESEALQTSVTELQTNVGDVTEDLEKTKNSLNNLSYRVSTTEDAVKKIPALETTVTSLNETVESHSTAIDEMETEVSSLSDSLSSTNTSLTNLSYRVSTNEDNIKKKYTKPDTGIPASDLAGSIPTSKITGLGSLATKSAIASGDIIDGTIVNADISTSAAIAQSKIANLTTDLAAKATTTALNAVKTTADNAMPKSGGKFTGSISWADNGVALPSKPSPKYFLSIDAFADGGKTYYTSLANAKTALGVTAVETSVAGKYAKPDGGIPKTDLANAVQTSLNNADNALPKSGGTMTGNLSVASKASINTSGYVTGTWLATTAATDLGAASEKIAVIGTTGNAKNYIYYRTPEELRSDIDAVAISSFNNLSYRLATAEEEAKKIPEIQNSLSAAEEAISTYDETLQTLQTNVESATKDLEVTTNSLNNLSYRVSEVEKQIKTGGFDSAKIKYGSASVSNASTKSISHGLGVTPSAVLISIQGPNDKGRNYYITAKTSSTFTVTFYSSNNAAQSNITCTINWVALAS